MQSEDGSVPRRAALVVDPGLSGDPRVASLPCDPADSDPAFLLAREDGVLDLRPPGEHDRPGVRAIFPPDRGGRGPNPLVRAFGPRIRVVHDLTAGLGGDAYRLAAAGYAVHGSERDRVVFALLESGWQNACEGGEVPREIRERLEFECAEAREVVTGLESEDLGVYVDPMYPPPRRASAKPRRALQILRAWLPSDTDTAPIVEHARELAARVVVKRPRHARPILPDPSHTIESKLVRFDVYVNPARLSKESS